MTETKGEVFFHCDCSLFSIRCRIFSRRQNPDSEADVRFMREIFINKFYDFFNVFILSGDRSEIA